MSGQRKRARVHGVDFSGARDAGRKVWVASGTMEGGVLRVEDCRRGDSLPGGGRDIARCLPALVEFIEGERTAGVGLDFPFGIPSALMKDASWEDFIVGFAKRYETPEDFKKSCLQAAGGAELKRRTDKECHTPFSAYNLRLYKQTFYGIRDVLGPLVTRGTARILPMQKPVAGRPSILEVCPASTLRQLGPALSYKGRTPEHLEARRQILQALRARVVVPERLTRKVLDDHEGDAVDCIVGALATSRSLGSIADDLPSNHDYMLEGRVYV